jgi:predicted nucleotidyltransferase
MSIKEEVLKYIKENKERFYKEYGIKEIYLFGSVARGEDNENSDIDLMVEFDDSFPMNFKRLFGVKFEMEERFKRKVDLLEKGAIRPRLREYVLRDLIEG